MKQYSFRLLLRDIIRLRAGFALRDLLRFNSPSAASHYMDILAALSVIGKEGEEYVLIKGDVSSFGPTLEWYVAEVLKREYGCRSWWGVAVKDTAAGGDFDVIAQTEGTLVYVDIKSSPPRQIEAKSIESFFKRIRDFGPDLAIFLEDTHLRMKDKIIPLFESLYPPFSGEKAATRAERIHRESFRIGGRIYIINSKLDLGVNLGLCLKDYFLRDRPDAL